MFFVPFCCCFCDDSIVFHVPQRVCCVSRIGKKIDFLPSVSAPFFHEFDSIFLPFDMFSVKILHEGETLDA